MRTIRRSAVGLCPGLRRGVASRWKRRRGASTSDRKGHGVAIGPRYGKAPHVDDHGATSSGRVVAVLCKIVDVRGPRRLQISPVAVLLEVMIHRAIRQRLGTHKAVRQTAALRRARCKAHSSMSTRGRLALAAAAKVRTQLCHRERAQPTSSARVEASGRGSIRRWINWCIRSGGVRASFTSSIASVRLWLASMLLDRSCFGSTRRWNYWRVRSGGARASNTVIRRWIDWRVRSGGARASSSVIRRLIDWRVRSGGARVSSIASVRLRLASMLLDRFRRRGRRVGRATGSTIRGRRSLARHGLDIHANRSGRRWIESCSKVAPRPRSSRLVSVLRAPVTLGSASRLVNLGLGLLGR